MPNLYENYCFQILAKQVRITLYLYFKHGEWVHMFPGYWASCHLPLPVNNCWL